MVATVSKQLFPSSPVEVGAVAVYQSEVYYSEVKSGVWRLATADDRRALKKGDRVAIADQNWVYSYIRWDTVEAEAVVQFIGYNFRTQIPADKLQIPNVHRDDGYEAEGQQIAEAMANEMAAPPKEEDEQIDKGGFYGDGEIIVYVASNWPVRVEIADWDGYYSLGFNGAISPTGFYSDIHVECDHADLNAYAQAKAHELFAHHVPRDAHGNLIFDGDRCKVLKGKHKGTAGIINGCVFEGKMTFKEPNIGQFAPSSLLRLEQSEISLKLIGSQSTAIASDNKRSAIIESPAESITTAIAPDPLDELADQIDGLLNHQSSLEILITDINALYGNLEEAEEVRESAEFSAFSFALEIGHKLIKAKAECGHGNWEATRAQIKSPRSGKPLPSSTATLYQRMAQRQTELEQQEVRTIRAAADALKSDRQLPASKSKSATVAETPPPSPSPPSPSSPHPKLPPDFATQSDEEAGLTPNTQYLTPICKPSITPEEFNQEISIPQFTGCHVCKHRVLTGSGDRYWCEQGEFDETIHTLLLKENWFEMNEGCKSFVEPVPQTKPTYKAPRGVLRLEDIEGGGKELHGFVLSEERFFKLTALARSLNGSMATALFQLIDQLPEPTQ